MFNLQGSEIIIIMLLALVVLGPEKLPDAMRRAGKMYADLKKMASGFQDEFRSVIDEPVREMQETANLLRDSADFTKLAEGERKEKPQSARMGDAGSLAPADPDQIPVDELPFGPVADPGQPVGSGEFDELPELSNAPDAESDEQPVEAKSTDESDEQPVVAKSTDEQPPDAKSTDDEPSP